MLVRRLAHLLSRAHRRESSKARAMCAYRGQVPYIRGESEWLGQRPFSDRYGYDGGFQPGAHSGDRFSGDGDTWDGGRRWKR
jgi:hypothetical protein